ncbi:MAG: DUF1127 domain-containing protein [Pseudomonadota bacterium]
MNPYYELPNVGNGFQRHEIAVQPEAQVDGIVSVTALRAVNAVDAALESFARWRRRRAAIRELDALSDRHLQDIGLHRSQIASTVDEIVKSGEQPSWRRARSWHGAPPGAANDNEAAPQFDGQTVARLALLQR